MVPHPMAENGSDAACAQDARVVNMARTRQDRVHEREDLATGERTADVPGIRDEARLVEGHADPVGTARF